MQLRDSGMPEEVYWESLLDVPSILQGLRIDPETTDVAELGCGYGTFSIPVAQVIRGTLYTFDIDPRMVARTRERAEHVGLRNVNCRLLDVMEHGFEVPKPVDALLLFNILHCDEPIRLFRHAISAVKPGGRVLVIHWRYDGATPRGPSLEIRPKPEQIVQWAAKCGGLAWGGQVLDFPPWHYGLTFSRTDPASQSAGGTQRDL